MVWFDYWSFTIPLCFFFSLNGIIFLIDFVLKIIWAGSSYQNFLRRSHPGYCRSCLNITLADLSSHCLLVIIISFTTFTQEPTLLNFFPPAHPSSVLEWKSKQGQKEDRAWALLGHRDRKLLYVVTFFFFLSVMCLLLLESNSFHLAMFSLRLSRETPTKETSSCSLKDTQQEGGALFVMHAC